MYLGTFSAQESENIVYHIPNPDVSMNIFPCQSLCYACLLVSIGRSEFKIITSYHW